MNILVRLPNWLGDVMMSLPLLSGLKMKYANANIDVIVKEGLEGLFDYFPDVSKVYAYNRDNYKGILAPRKFARKVSSEVSYDLFYNLLISESSYVMSSAIEAKKKIGFKRGLFSSGLSVAKIKPEGMHRVNEYLSLLDDINTDDLYPSLVNKKRFHAYLIEKPAVLINVNSEAVSRTVPKEVIVNTINLIHKQFKCHIVFSGVDSDKDYVKSIIKSLDPEVTGMNFSGKTNVNELCQLVYEADAVLSTDSGIAHIANAYSKPLMVLFGAGDENNTGPYNPNNLVIYRKPGMECTPCVSNTCKFGTVACLADIDAKRLSQAFIELLESSGIKK